MMKKIILSLVLMITIVVNLSSQNEDFFCRQQCYQQVEYLFATAQNNRTSCVQQCHKESEQSWVDKIECMINGDCDEEEKENDDFDEYCVLACDVEFEACMEVIYCQVQDCLSNC
jgi:hypothetical protein